MVWGCSFPAEEGSPGYLPLGTVEGLRGVVGQP